MCCDFQKLVCKYNAITVKYKEHCKQDFISNQIYVITNE